MDTPPPTLAIIIGSTRPGRAGEAVAQWFDALAREHGGFEVQLVDLAEVNLPLLDEPRQAVHRQYEHDHTRRWSAIIERSDAVVFVIPEYNHSVNGATKNAVDYLYHEWRYKPFGIVCYGGASRGLRAAHVLEPVLTSLKMTYAGDVSVSLIATPVVDGGFSGDATLARSATALLDELGRTSVALRPLRP